MERSLSSGNRGSRFEDAAAAVDCCRRSFVPIQFKEYVVCGLINVSETWSLFRGGSVNEEAPAVPVNRTIPHPHPFFFSP